MNKSIFAIASLVLLTTAAYMTYNNQATESSTEVNHQFQTFMQKFNKKYASVQEHNYRLAVFMSNLIHIKSDPTFGITQFMDLTQEEFGQLYLTAFSDNLRTNVITQDFEPTAEESIDWVARGAVQPVKDQGQCGSCWAFGATGVLEGHFWIHGQGLLDFSEQQLVDCSTLADFNLGCNGGMHSRALNYVKRNGITTQQAYPYTGIQGPCKIKGGDYHINGNIILTPTESTLIGALQQQPVTVDVNASSWQYYTHGVLGDCSDKTNHIVLAVGYNAESFKLKNSWGTSWGDKGFIYLKRGQNTCGVYSNAVIPK